MRRVTRRVTGHKSLDGLMELRDVAIALWGQRVEEGGAELVDPNGREP